MSMHAIKRISFLCLALALVLAATRPVEAAKLKAAVCRPVPHCEPAAPKAAQPMPFVPGSWTIVLLPDTQHYSETYPGLFSMQTNWIVKNKDKLNIRYVLMLGDITNSNTSREWECARDALGNLDGHVPYAMVMGNHDCSRFRKGSTDRDTPMNHYFPAAQLDGRPDFGGLMKPGRIENAYYLFSAGGSDWLVIVLEWAPRDEAVAWANAVCDRYPQRKAILVTHAYMYCDDTRYDFARKGKSQTWNPHAYGPPGSINDGEELWNKLVRRHSFVFTFNGHVLNRGTGFLSSKNDQGRTVHQMLVNYQTRKLGGEGYLRLIEVLPDGKTVHAVSYSPLYDSCLTQPDQQFSFELN
jgi:hypothetical protein